MSGLAVLVLLLDLWIAPKSKSAPGIVAVVGLLVILGLSFLNDPTGWASSSSMVAQDGLAVFFQRLFLVATIFVLLMAHKSADRIPMGVAEFHIVVLMALTGMMLAAAANDFALLFVSLELITITFYVLVSFQRYGAAFARSGREVSDPRRAVLGVSCFRHRADLGTTGKLNFRSWRRSRRTSDTRFLAGVLLVLRGSGSKLRSFPSRSGRRMFIKARRRRRRPFWRSAPRRRALSCCCGFYSRRVPADSRATGPTC